MCGWLGKCFVREVSESIYYHDEYAFECEKCGFTTKERVDKGSTISGTRITKCPFCGKSSKEHEKTPKELSQNPAT